MNYRSSQAAMNYRSNKRCLYGYEFKREDEKKTLSCSGIGSKRIYSLQSV